MTDVELFTDTERDQTDHSVRGNVMSGQEMQDASDKVLGFLESDAAKDLFTKSERVYADLTLGLITERGDELRTDGRRAPMGPAFMDTYRHLRGLMQEERASANPDRQAVNELADAHAAGETASAKLDALLAAAHHNRSFKTAVDYIESPDFAQEHPSAPERGPDPFANMDEEQKRKLAASLMKDLFNL